MKNTGIKSVILTATMASALLFGSCKTQQEYVERRPGPPTVIERGTPPFEGAIWVQNEYRWEPASKTYVVVPGHWDHPTHAGAVWVNGHWRHVAHGYAWVPGHWK